MINLPCRFQLGDYVRACGVRGHVTAVTFSDVGKVFYDVSHSGGCLVRIMSDDVTPVSPVHLHLVAEGTA